MTDVTGRGGAEKALVDLALRLDRTRYNVTVCATRSAGNYQPMLEAAGVQTFVLDRRSRWETHKLIGLARLMRRQRVHILHTHLFGSNTWGRILGKLAGVPVIIAHEHWSSKSQREVWVDKLLYRLSDRILVPSEASKRMVMEVEGIPDRHLHVIYNGIDRAQFAPRSDRAETRSELGIPDGIQVIGTVGRLSVEKGGVDLLIKAVARLRNDHPQARLVVVGDGPLREGLEEVAARLGKDVIFTGTRTDVARLLNAMDIFVLPSLHEAFPIAILEAMAVRLPVVATRVGGVPEVIQDGTTGLLVPPNDEQALHKSLRRLLTESQLAESLAQAGHRFYQQVHAALFHAQAAHCAYYL
ncbi:MAG TPA: glycosyltransferase, partial [Chloroflexia bacterium]|nr:glycosyltransferase [Chloroflexia bacterium]